MRADRDEDFVATIDLKPRHRAEHGEMECPEGANRLAELDAGFRMVEGQNEGLRCYRHRCAESGGSLRGSRQQLLRGRRHCGARQPTYAESHVSSKLAGNFRWRKGRHRNVDAQFYGRPVTTKRLPSTDRILATSFKDSFGISGAANLAVDRDLRETWRGSGELVWSKGLELNFPLEQAPY